MKKINLLFIFFLFAVLYVNVFGKNATTLVKQNVPPGKQSLKSNARDPADSGVFLLHKLEHLIGKETYHNVKAQDKINCAITFKVADRGTPAMLNAALETTLLNEPVNLKFSGKISSGLSINDTIHMSNGLANIKLKDSTYTTKLTSFTFPVPANAPGTLQQELLRYWNSHHRPSVIKTLPYGSVQIRMRGTDTFIVNKQPVVCNCYTINGLVWGNEFLWADKQGDLIGLISNDNTGDKFEFIREPYESLLSQFIHKTAVYGTRLLTAQLGESRATPVIAITGGTLIDVNTGKAEPNSVIILEHGIIKSIGKVGILKVPAHSTIIDARGKTILPGLWDMHAHFGQAEWGPAYLAAGVTTIRDCTDEFDYINPAEKVISGGKGIGPRILKAGLIDGTGPNAFGIVQANTKEGAKAAVDRYQKNGYVQIKIYSSVKPAIVKAICEEAHRVGLTVTGHIPAGMTLKQGIDSGMDMVNHIYYVQPMMKLNKDYSINFDDSVTRAAIGFLAAHHTVVDPTIGSMELTFRPKQGDITGIEPAFYTFPEVLQRRFKDAGMDQATSDRYQPLYQDMLRLVKVLFDAGVPVVAGSDQGFPGYSLDRELELYVQAGLTQLQAIQSATIVPARVMGMDKETGSIEEGKQADMVIVDGNPLIHIRDIRKVVLTIKGNHIYHPTNLHILAGFSK
ncbi:amidohydrolase family protein [Mucilaginibacter sp. X4EP1]|uniref:amidohydrolase family protein n=1 Tax=Mucilaginibacter sp. X4EP1 TaxID=2723092 RepID=UPI00216861CA|nr:amidohydrolase family protein [Mucilaginibacter sp. X4EP1]MCS3811550.1 imidazolonepropionase-like amidohydrolase [Mucilaginibacter sp. X4EP1]